MAKSLPLQSEFDMELGSGHIGRVFKAEKRGLFKRKAQTVAVKVLKDDDEQKFDHSNVEEIVKGVQVMEMCIDHPHIISLFDFYTCGNEFYIIMEYAIHGNLFDFLNENSPKNENSAVSLTQNECNVFAYQVAMGMEYLSSQKVGLFSYKKCISITVKLYERKMSLLQCVHRDLCARNILVCTDYDVKIGGFGMAKYLNDSEYYSPKITEHLAAKWIAPEVISERRHYVKSDVYVLLCIAYNLKSD